MQRLFIPRNRNPIENTDYLKLATDQGDGDGEYVPVNLPEAALYFKMTARSCTSEAQSRYKKCDKIHLHNLMLPKLPQ